MAAPPPRRVAILGYGLAGRVFHAPLIAATPQLEVAAIVTADPGRAARARHDHPEAQVLADSDALFDHADEFGLVVVATPNQFHLPLALRSIESGLAVVVDKPLAASAADGRRLIERSRAAGVPLTVFQNRRWDGDFLTLRSLLDQGRLGRIHRFESRFQRWRPEVAEKSWREIPDPARAGGLLYDLGSHLIDQALQLFGPVSAVYAELDRRREGSAVDDDDFIALTHAGGVRSHLWMSALVAQLGPRFRVLSDRTGYTKYGLDGQEAQLVAGLLPGSEGWGKEAAEDHGFLGTGEYGEVIPTLPGAYQDFYSGVAAALAAATPPPVDPQDALAALVVIEAARLSASTREVVRLGQNASPSE
ncbi:MAG TPA: Gfo/Idh/MocA family oxidoreductase [Candidatus Dormibacteraeota bacterium]|nr:Gfo/Idh/MocA family oxidoreductase [Candidatus Dormibacteraeota bacterium]